MVSVVVCTFNRVKYLRICLEKLANQTANFSEYEIIVVDNNSTDGSRLACESFINTHKELNVNYFLELKQGHTYSRNRGITESKGEYLAFIDDDAFVAINYIENIKKAFSNFKISALGGKITPRYESGNPPVWMSKYLLPLVAALDMGEYKKYFKKGKYPIGANMAFRKNIFRDLGFFNIDLGRRGSKGLEGGDEKDIFIKLHNSGAKVLYDPDVKVTHIIPESRLQLTYIKGLAVGVGSSERKRLKSSGIYQKTHKILSELIKIAGTGVLFFSFLFKGKVAAAKMLVVFRFWVITGYFK